IVVIPAKSTVFTFHCQNCDRKINVPKTYVGKEVQCPSCKERFIVPVENLENSPETQNTPAQMAFSAEALTFLDVPAEYKLKDPPAHQMSESEKAILRELESEEDQSEESIDERKLPWVIDIFLHRNKIRVDSDMTVILVVLGWPRKESEPIDWEGF
ncbi:hypothetical protein KJ628_06190, partial [Patescibacteria group bacterium]|nr:hypothetical protein [Patescibacteria group bacterium]